MQEKESATVFVEIPKQKHKYLMAQKGNGIQDILLETNVSVEMPQQDSDKETVTLRGLYKDLGTGKFVFLMHLVYSKYNYHFNFRVNKVV